MFYALKSLTEPQACKAADKHKKCTRLPVAAKATKKALTARDFYKKEKKQIKK
jgi:hypothetical protein